MKIPVSFIRQLRVEEIRLTAELEQVRAIMQAATGTVSAPRKARAKAGKTGKRGSNLGAKLGQYNRHYWSAKKAGNTQKADDLLKKLKAAGKEPWKVKSK